MITVTLFRESGSVVKVRASGHSGLGEHGQDILCAAVSTLVQTAYLAIADITSELRFKRDDKTGLFEFDVPQVQDKHDIDVIIRAMCVGLRDLVSGYPQNLKLEEA
ncbi:MAG: ribosomal-processing cysteine protease Prp [Clostridiales bacterium]|nr:ribosomal-processing cysteine protease Prp [Clostridiales bacterium]